MIHELGVIFNFHKNDDVTGRNLGSFMGAGPTLIISTKERMPMYFEGDSHKLYSDVHISECGHLGRLWERLAINRIFCWRNCDIPFFARYAANTTLKCKRWLLVEWDTLCLMPDIRHFARRTEGLDVVAPAIALSRREDTWCWFQEMDRLPRELRPHATGLVPLSGVILSDRAMKRITEFYTNEMTEDLERCFCELRLGTIAGYCGFPAVPNSHPAARDLTWIPYEPGTLLRPGSIYHPVKYMVQ